jgi:hypothetical protein
VFLERYRDKNSGLTGPNGKLPGTQANKEATFLTTRSSQRWRVMASASRTAINAVIRGSIDFRLAYVFKTCLNFKI